MRKPFVTFMIAVLCCININIFAQSLWKYMIDNFEVFRDNVVSQQIKNFKVDLDSDNSFQKFLGFFHGINDKNYRPNDLVRLSGIFYIFALNPYLRYKPAYYFSLLADGFYKHFHLKLCVKSAFRSYNLQKSMLYRYCDKYECARPGFSEHQLGTAVDIGVYLGGKCQTFWFDSPYYKWLSKNAYKFGFNNTFKIKSQDGFIKPEPWHWDFNGILFSFLLHKYNLTISEFYNLLQTDNLPVSLKNLVISR